MGEGEGEGGRRAATWMICKLSPGCAPKTLSTEMHASLKSLKSPSPASAPEPPQPSYGPREPTSLDRWTTSVRILAVRPSASDSSWSCACGGMGEE